MLIHGCKEDIEMKEVNLGILTFEGYKSFDTREEADKFTTELGDRFIRIIECKYPDLTFYIVEYDTPRAYFKGGD